MEENGTSLQKVEVVGSGAWKTLSPQIFAYRYGERTFTTVRQYNGNGF
jgi:hypothetical protein